MTLEDYLSHSLHFIGLKKVIPQFIKKMISDLEDYLIEEGLKNNFFETKKNNENDQIAGEELKRNNLPIKKNKKFCNAFIKKD